MSRDISNNILRYLNKIAKHLWSGHAAVMVGSGFSMNAKPKNTSSSRFPDWPQLGDLLYEKVRGDKPGPKDRYLNVLKLAGEVEARFDRPTLNQALRDAIPDTDYEPSPLHVKLLDLPWTDVFTTNYDTLLERACASVISQNYDVVIENKDLVNSTKPRIIKLHGSFPSDLPFIITEEDYRKYPRDFAPFVNTVQQALLENTLCLIGFSGDDPNFLQWIGWIRDNLGEEKFREMYLVGVFNFFVAQRRLLQKRNIILVNMPGCAEIEEDHYNGLKKFLNYLNSKKTEENRLGWPENLKKLSPDSKKNKEVQLEEILPIWKQQRLSYPGWVVVPEDRRSALWNFTQFWVDFVSPKDSLPNLIDLEFAFELNWRIEKCLCPLPNQTIEFFKEVLGMYFDEALSNKPLPATHKEIKERNLDIRGIREMCIHLLLSTMRFYREEGLLEKWKENDSKIETTRKYLSREHKAMLGYERALYALFRLDLPELKDKLSKWRVNESLPFWEAKRAGLLAEIGQVDEAKKILEKSLKNIRAKLNLKPITTDYSLVSEESIVMLLLQYVQISAGVTTEEWLKNKEIRNKFFERWNTLKQYKCDPWNELTLFKNVLERPPVEVQGVTEKQEFDLGRVTQTAHFGKTDQEALTAYSFLRFCEDMGVPFRIPGSRFGEKAAEGTLSRISKYSPYWAMATMVRIGDKKVVDHIFNRESLYQMDVVAIDGLIQTYLDSLEKSGEDVQSGSRVHSDNFGVVLAKVIPETLSRLCCKCSSELREKLLDFLLNIYISSWRGNYEGILNLTERLLNSFSTRQRFNLIPRLMDFPVLENLNPLEKREFVNPFLFINIDKELVKTWSKPSISDEKVNVSLQKASSDDQNTRKWAITTLGKLYNFELLDTVQTDKFAKVLWNKLDNFGFPSQTNYYKFAFLDLPHPEAVNPVSLFKTYIKKKEFPIQKRGVGIGITITGGEVPICREIVGASNYLDWTNEEIISILNRIIKWWNTDKDFLHKKDLPLAFGSIADEFRGRFANLVDVLVAAIVPHFSQDTRTNRKNKLLCLIRDLQKYSLPTLRLESACLHIYPELRIDVRDKIEKGLTSIMHETVMDSLKSVRVIAESTDRDSDDQELTQLINMLGQMVIWRNETGLSSVLNMLRVLIRKHSTLFAGEFEKLVLAGLQNLVEDTFIAMGRKGVKFAEWLDVRQKAAGLAYEIFLQYTKRGKAVPSVIVEWQKICRSDNEFAEIINQWIE